MRWKGSVRATIVAALAAALTLAVAAVFLDVVVDRWPLLHDPEFGTRLELLQHQMAESPQKPVLVFVGIKDPSKLGDLLA